MKKTLVSSIPNKRNRAQYPALTPSLNLKTRQDLIDYDYLNKLNEDEMDWLNKFSQEFIVATLDSKPKNNKHNTKALAKDCYDKNNSRNRDVLTRQKATGRIKYLDDIIEKTQNPEDYLILQMDMQKGGYLDKDGNIIKKDCDGNDK